MGPGGRAGPRWAWLLGVGGCRAVGPLGARGLCPREIQGLGVGTVARESRGPVPPGARGRWLW